MAKPVGTAATTRLRKLECASDCGYIVRVSRSAMDRGLPMCCCGGRLVPATLEDAFRAFEAGHLSADELALIPEVDAYERARVGAARGQNGSRSRPSWELRGLDDIAFARVVKDRRVAAVANQRRAILPAADPIPF